MTTRRRVTGEGAIYRRKDGRWCASVDAGNGPRSREARTEVEEPLAATRKRTTVYGVTRREVEVKLQALRRNHADGLPVVDQRTTVGGFLEAWLERIAPRLRRGTLLRYRGLVERQLIPNLGHVRLARLQPADVDKMLATLAATPRAQTGRVPKDGKWSDGPRATLSPLTVHHARAVLRAALTDAERWGLVTRNVAKLSAAPRVPKPSPKMLSVEDVHLVIDAVRGTDVGNPVMVALYSGLRQGEVLGLRWSDLALDAGQLTVSKALQRLQGETRLVELKSQSSQRTIQLPSPAVAALRDERRRQRERELAAPAGRWKLPIPDLVFTDATGSPLVPSSVLSGFQRSLRLAGLPSMRFHHLRHLHAMLMLASGSDIAVVSHVLGHSSIALTASTYAGVMPALKRAAADRFELLLSRPI